MPPEYLEYAVRQSDFDDDKAWLESNHPEIYDELFNKAAEDGEEGGAAGKPKKRKGKVGFSDAEKVVKFVKLKRSGKKFISTIMGLEKFGVDLTEAAKIISKKYGTGAAAMQV